MVATSCQASVPSSLASGISPSNAVTRNTKPNTSRPLNPGQETVPRNSRAAASMPASSRSSRRIAATMSSPGSTFPPSPLYLPSCSSDSRATRCTSSTRERSGVVT